MQIGRSYVEGERQAQRINKNVPALRPLRMLVGIKSRDAGRPLTRLHADGESMIAALGSAFLPLARVRLLEGP